MASGWTEEIKEHLKENIAHGRERKKDDILSHLRHIPCAEKKPTTNDFPDLVVLLKKHGSDKTKVLSDLKVYFHEEPFRIVEFLKIEGALHTLVGLILGKDAFVQLLAIECCCNLSLGDSKACYQVAKAGTPYFTSILKGLNYNLIGSTLQTVGNLCNASLKSCQLLLGQGILSCLLDLTSVKEVRENAFYALLQLTRIALDELKDEEVSSIAEKTMAHYSVDVSAQWLAVEVSRRAIEQLHNCNAVDLAVSLYLSSAEPEISSLTIRSATAAVRLLANFCLFQPAAVQVLSKLQELSNRSEAYLHSEYRHLGRETLWMFANLVSSPAASCHLRELETGLASLVRTAMLQPVV